MRRGVLAVVFGLALALPARALADEIAVIAPAGDEAAVARVVRELEALGLTVSRDAAAGRPTLALRADGGFDLVDRAPSGAERSRAIAARDPLAVAEEVHALLLPPLAPASAPPVPVAPPAARPAPTPDAPAAPAPEEPLGLEASLGFGVLRGAKDPGGAVAATVSYSPPVARFGRVALAGAASATYGVVPESVSSAEGRALVRPLVFGPELVAKVGVTRSAAVHAALGVGAAYVSFTGRATSPYTSRDDAAWTVTPSARLRGQWASGVLSLHLEGRAGLATPPLEVRFAGDDVASWGSPWLYGGAGVGATF